MGLGNSIFTGKIRKSAGNVTARIVKGRTIYSQKIVQNNSKSLAQVYNRMRFKFAAVYAQLLYGVVKTSFVERGKYQSSYNAFVSACIPNSRIIGGKDIASSAVVPFAPATTLISKGTLANPLAEPTLSLGENSAVVVGGCLGAGGTALNLAKQVGIGSCVNIVAVVYDNITTRYYTAQCQVLRTGDSTVEQNYSANWRTFGFSHATETSPLSCASRYIIVALGVFISNSLQVQFSTSRIVALSAADMRVVVPVSDFPKAYDYVRDFTPTAADIRNLGWQIDSPSGYAVQQDGGNYNFAVDGGVANPNNGPDGFDENGANDAFDKATDVIDK